MSLVLFPGIHLAGIFAMGSKGGAVQSPDNRRGEERWERDHEGEKSGEGLSPKEDGSQKKEKAPPEKKPRLKYRDEPGCSC
jgi:hypothetical protein